LYCIAFEHLNSASHSIKPYIGVLVFIQIFQAYVERIFSLCGLLTARCRSRTSQNPEMRVLNLINN